MSAFVLFLTYLLLGALSIVIAVPLIQGRVRPNPWYGVRVRKTLENQDTWYAVNAYFGRRFAVFGLCVAIAAVALSPLGLLPHIGAAAYLFVGNSLIAVGFLWIMLDTFRFLRRF